MKEQPKKAFLGPFWKYLTKKLHARPSNLVYFGAKGAFRQILGSVSQTWISEKSTKGDPLGRQGDESLKKGGAVRPPPPKSAGGPIFSGHLSFSGAGDADFSFDLDTSDVFLSSGTKGRSTAIASDGSVYYEAKTSTSYVRTISGRFHGKRISFERIIGGGIGFKMWVC